MTAVGITGHQNRPEIDWAWVRRSFVDQLVQLRTVDEGYSSLAIGADQLFAEVLLELRIALIAVIPMAEYEKIFPKKDRQRYLDLMSQGRRVELAGSGDAQQSFYQAGKYIVEKCDVLFAVWDGKASHGYGGTGDIVGFARRIGRPVIHFNIQDNTIVQL